MLRLKKHRQKRDVLGFRLPMFTHEEPELDIADITIIHPDNTFYMPMGSDAMRSYHNLQDHVLIIDRSLTPVPGSIVAFFYDGDFYVREYSPAATEDAGKITTIQLKADTPRDTITIPLNENNQTWTCWGVVLLSLNPLLQPAHKLGRYAVFANVDINNCYVSCDRLFDPALENWVVVVLSNNDGCVIVLSNEAKAIGIKMADAEFMVRQSLKEHNAAIFSRNYALYADMSARLMNNLARYTYTLMVCSIDEAFMGLNNIKDINLEAHPHH